MPFISQTRHRGPGRFLQLKVWLFSAGAILLLVGMARNLDLLVAAAIAVLAVAFFLRFFERDDDHEVTDEEDYADEDEPVEDEAAPAGGTMEDRADMEPRPQPIED